jgi:hypothetical protein
VLADLKIELVFAVDEVTRKLLEQTKFRSTYVIVLDCKGIDCQL